MQIQNKEQYHQQKKTDTERGMSTRNTIHIEYGHCLFFFFSNIIRSFSTLLTASMGDKIIFTKNVENQLISPILYMGDII